METEHAEGALVHLSPDKIMADDNIRYSTLAADVEALKAQIKEMGGVQTAVDIEPLETPQNGYEYRLRTGFRRHRAVTELNKEEGAGLTLPAIIRAPIDPLARTLAQFSENEHRKNLSPMDHAVAIKKMFDQGLSRVQIRDKFQKPAGRRGKEQLLKPASNAWVNMTLSFLDLPKDIRERIHDGRVGVAAAYELTRVTPEKRAAVMERAEAERQKEQDREEAEEKKFLAQESKLTEAQEKEKEAVVAIDTAKAEVEVAQKLVAETIKLAKDKYQVARQTKGEAKKAAEEAFKAAEVDVKGAEKKLASATKELEKQAAAKDRLSKLAADHKEKLEAARKKASVGKPKGKGVGAKEIKEAAQAEGAGTGLVPLTAQQMRKTISDLALVTDYPKVAAIGAAIKGCFDGGPTPGMLVQQLAAITSELKPAKRK